MYIFKYSTSPIFWNNDSIDKPLNVNAVDFNDFLPNQNTNVNFVEQYLIHFSCENKNITYLSIYDDETNETNYYFVNQILGINSNIITYSCEMDIWLSKTRLFKSQGSQANPYFILSYTNFISNKDFGTMTPAILYPLNKIPFSDEYRIEATQTNVKDFTFWQDSYVKNYRDFFNEVPKNPFYSSDDAMKSIYNLVSKQWENFVFNDNKLPQMTGVDITNFKENGIAFVYKINVDGVTNYFCIPSTKNIDFKKKILNTVNNDELDFNIGKSFEYGLPKNEAFVGIMFAPKFIDFILSTPQNPLKPINDPNTTVSQRSMGSNYYVNFIYQIENVGGKKIYHSVQGFNLNFFFDGSNSTNENNFFILMDIKKDNIYQGLPAQMYYNNMYLFGTKIHPSLYTYQSEYNTTGIYNHRWVGFDCNLSFNEFQFSFSNNFVSFDFPKRFNDVTTPYLNYVNSTYNSYNTSLSIYKDNMEHLKFQNNLNFSLNSVATGANAFTNFFTGGGIKGVVNAATDLAKSTAEAEFKNQNLEREYNNSVNSLNATRQDLARSQYGEVSGLGQENSVALNFVNNWFFSYSEPLIINGFYKNAGDLIGLPCFSQLIFDATYIQQTRPYFLKYEPEMLRLRLLQMPSFTSLNKNYQAKIIQDLLRGIRIWPTNVINIST